MKRVTLIPGDGIGLEVTAATVRLLEAAGAQIEWEEKNAKPTVGRRAEDSQADPVVDSITRTRVGLKGPLTTPVGVGHRSINVALRVSTGLKGMGEVEKLVREFDIKVAIHNHGPEDRNFPTPQSVLEAVKGMDPRCGLCMDLGHSLRTGADVVRSIAEAGPRLMDMHMKDLRTATEKSSQCEVGRGVMPVVAIFKQLKKMKYPGYINLEYEINSDNPLPGMASSLAYMRGVLAGMAG